ncbi:MAG: CTP synthase (glutamine hydrolyzing), partial [Actinomycetota bacterium]
VGDIESLPFLEAIRQFKKDIGKENVLYIHVTYVPYLKTSDELKTKPTQHSVKELRSIGIQPDIIICRSESAIDEGTKSKISLFCDIEKEAIISATDAKHLYEIPLNLKQEKFDEIVVSMLGLDCGKANLESWEKIVNVLHDLKGRVVIGIVGKYTNLKDAYISIVESLNHGGYSYNTNVEIRWINSENLDEDFDGDQIFAGVHGILVPGGFGIRGINGKVKAIKYARENKIPFFGICLGMQCAVVDFSRNVIGLKDAHSSEFDTETKNNVIYLMPDQEKISNKGGTMRLGRYPCLIKKDTKAYEAYQEDLVYERHRHRFELNNYYRSMLEENGMIISGIYPDKDLVEIVELKDHPWFVGVQFHPEFKSRPLKPHPLFAAFGPRSSPR